MEHTIERYFPTLADFWNTPVPQIEAFWAELCASRAFLENINTAIAPVPEFTGVRFDHPSEMRVYRCLLYLCARALKPGHFVETGVQNGMSSAYILLALAHNGQGHLSSIDLPPLDARVLAQGTNPLPAGKAPGWLIPEGLRARHSIILAPAEAALPELLARLETIDAFLHDSDHCYAHMMFEVALAWRYLRAGGCLMVDNIEQNDAFTDFARGVQTRPVGVASFGGPNRIWRHGLMMKPNAA